MTFVERSRKIEYPSFVWGKDIRVKVDSDELEVSAVVPVGQEDYEAAPDVLRSYRRAVRRFEGPKRQGMNSPHIEFANADSDQRLIKFVQRFGPVVVNSLRTEEREILPQGPFEFRTTETISIARQNLKELRSEQITYRSALRLVSELRRGKQAEIPTLQRCVMEIVENVSAWPLQWERERKLRANKGYVHQPQWLFRQDNLDHLETYEYYVTREDSGGPLGRAMAISPTDASHHIICELINAFPPLVYLWGDHPVEAPDWDLAAGIRPVLYYIFRKEYLQAGGINICRNTECRNLFEIERTGQEFCGDVCSRLQRQREYWQNRGKKMRRQRLQAKEPGNLKESRKKRRERNL